MRSFAGWGISRKEGEFEPEVWNSRVFGWNSARGQTKALSRSISSPEPAARLCHGHPTSYPASFHGHQDDITGNPSKHYDCYIFLLFSVLPKQVLPAIFAGIRSLPTGIKLCVCCCCCYKVKNNRYQMNIVPSHASFM